MKDRIKHKDGMRSSTKMARGHAQRWQEGMHKDSLMACTKMDRGQAHPKPCQSPPLAPPTPPPPTRAPTHIHIQQVHKRAHTGANPAPGKHTSFMVQQPLAAGVCIYIHAQAQPQHIGALPFCFSFAWAAKYLQRACCVPMSLYGFPNISGPPRQYCLQLDPIHPHDAHADKWPEQASQYKTHASSRVMRTCHTHLGVPVGSQTGWWDDQKRATKPTLPSYLRHNIPNHFSRTLSRLRLSGHNLDI